MKKRKILVLFPFLGLLLSGCTFQEGLSKAKGLLSQYIYQPIKNLIGGDEKEEESGGDDKQEATVTGIKSVEGPKSCYVNEKPAESEFELTLSMSDGTEKKAAPTQVDLDVSAPNAAAKGTVHYGDFTKEFTIAVKEKAAPPVGGEKTPAEIIALCDEAGEGNVVKDLIRVKGTVAFGSAKDNYGWSGKFEEKSGDKELIFGSVQTEEEYETLDGATVVIEGYAELYEGVYKVSYLPAKASPTGQAFNPTLVSVVPAAPKTVSAIVSVESAPAAVYVGDGIDKNDVVLNVTFSDGSSGKAHPDKVVVNTEVAEESVTATAYIGELTITFKVKVAEKGKTVHEGTAEDPYTVSDAKVIFDGLESGQNTDGEVYVTGTIAAEPAPKINNKRGQFYITDGVCEKNLYIYNIDGINKAELKVEDIPAGSVVVAKGAIKNYSGTFELCYVKDVAGCELISIEKPAEKEITGLIANSATGIPESIEQGKSLNKNSITVGVNYSDGTTGTVHPDEIQLDTSVPKDAVQGKLIVKTFEYLFTIKVTEKVAPQGETTITATIAEIAQANGWENDTQYKSFSLDENVSVVANTDGTYTGKYFSNDNSWRLYQTDSGTALVDAGERTIKSATFTFTIKDKGILLLNGEQITSKTAVEINASSFTLSVGSTEGTKGKVCITAIEITYDAGAPTPVVDVASVSVDPTKLELDVSDEPAQLSATVLPEDATNKSVTWSSSAENVAKVSAEGLVTPVASGNAVITAKAGDKTAECAVKVTTKVQSVEITETLNLVAGNEGNVYVSILPANADDLTYTLISSNPEVATVDEEGLVTAKAEGQTTITVKTNDGEKTDTCLVTVSALEIPVEYVELECEETIEMKIGDKLTLNAHGMPENATQDRAVEWALHDSDSEILVVYSDGRIEALKEGTVTVRATSVSNSEAHADVTVTVSKVAVESVELNKDTLTLTVDESETLVATVSPDNATDNTVVWSSSDEEVATVDQAGLVTAIAQGEATITAEADGKSATCVVTVEEAAPEKGTLENPYTVSEALEAFASLENYAWSDERVYVEGNVKEYLGAAKNHGYTLTDGEQDLIVYKSALPEEGYRACVGDTAIFYGWIENFKGTLEMTNYNAPHDALPELAAIVSRGTSEISLADGSSEHATVTFDSTAANASELSFTVAVDSGYNLVSVKVNGELVSEDNGVYKFVVLGDSSIKVETIEEGSSEVSQTASYSGGTTNMDGTNQAELLGVSDSHISIVGTKENGGTVNVGLNKAGQIRLYAAEKCALTISIDGGTINSLDIEIGGTYNGLNLNGSAISGAAANKIVSVDVNGTSAALTNPAASGQTYIISIVIHYTLN